MTGPGASSAANDPEKGSGVSGAAGATEGTVTGPGASSAANDPEEDRGASGDDATEGTETGAAAARFAGPGSSGGSGSGSGSESGIAATGGSLLARTTGRGGALALGRAGETRDRAAPAGRRFGAATLGLGRDGSGDDDTRGGGTAASTGSAANTSNLPGAGASARRPRLASTMTWSTTEKATPDRNRARRGARGGGWGSVAGRGYGVGLRKNPAGGTFMPAAGRAYLPLPTPVAGRIGVNAPAG